MASKSTHLSSEQLKINSFRFSIEMIIGFLSIPNLTLNNSNDCIDMSLLESIQSLELFNVKFGIDKKPIIISIENLKEFIFNCSDDRCVDLDAIQLKCPKLKKLMLGSEESSGFSTTAEHFKTF